MKTVIARLTADISVVLLLVHVGCSAKGPDRPNRVAVRGMVTLNKSPLPGATVTLEPQGHAFAAVGLTDAEGRFQLMTFEPNDGAVPGEFKVTVSKQESGTGKIIVNDDVPSASGPPRLLVPEIYVNSATSGLTASITEAGPNELTFELTGTPSNKPMKLPPPPVHVQTYSGE